MKHDDNTKQNSLSTTQATIDREKLRSDIRKLGNEYHYYLLDRAIDLLSDLQLVKLLEGYIDAKRFIAADNLTEDLLLIKVRRFEQKSLAGEYYVSFNVNSKNCREQSSGTTAFITDFHRFLALCHTETRKGNFQDAREAYDIILSIVRHIDECNDDVIFFADEGGSYMIGIDWREVFPMWFTCLAATTSSDEYAQLVTKGILEFDRHYKDRHFDVACQLANPSQKEALITFWAMP